MNHILFNKKNLKSILAKILQKNKNGFLDKIQ